MQWERLGPYRIERRIGRGGMGIVYSAVTDVTGERTAVKVLPTDGRDDGLSERFAAEIDSLRMLSHPNIVRILGYGEEQDCRYYVMELIDGLNLQELIDRGQPLLWQEATRIGVQVCRALKHAHDHGVIHRDIKPANLLLSRDGLVKLSDFGIAKTFGNSGLTADGGVIGTAEYMSPEQADGRPVTSRTDLYSLGGVLYALLAGRPPFRARNFVDMLQMQRFAEPEPLVRVVPTVPRALNDLVLHLLQKDPAKRYANGGEFGARLTRVYQQLKAQWDGIDRHEHFDTLRRLSFFHDFSQAEIHDLLRASEWREYMAGDEIIREGTADDRFYVIVTGRVSVESNGRGLGMLNSGDCFGETGYVSGARSISSFRAQDAVTVLSVSSTILEQVSTECQLRFNKVFLRTLIRRLQGANNRADPA
ncbi:MAG: protein kinase [Planctomycetes bacterium]|nr:protein kinase [Planctomycetota bacterium]